MLGPSRKEERVAFSTAPGSPQISRAFRQDLALRVAVVFLSGVQPTRFWPSRAVSFGIVRRDPARALLNKTVLGGARELLTVLIDGFRRPVPQARRWRLSQARKLKVLSGGQPARSAFDRFCAWRNAITLGAITKIFHAPHHDKACYRDMVTRQLPQ
jgi:hypothetical protein